MVKISQGDIFGRIGSGLGQGLADQLPKEMERGRLASGLQQISQQEGLTPFQQFSALASLPGVTPQMIQSGAELLRQQGISRGYGKIAGQQGAPSNVYQPGQPNVPGQGGALPRGPEAQGRATAEAFNQYGPKEPTGTRDVATVGPTQATLNPYIPRNLQQLQARAGQLQQQHPEIYPSADLAMQGAKDEDQQLRLQNEALQGQRKGEQDVQSTLRNQLQEVAKNANVNIPDNVYQPIEDQALEDVKTGRKTELEAAKDARDKLDKISREYKSLDSIGKLGWVFQNTNEIKRSLKETRDKFKERNDLENLAQSYIAKNGISPSKAYYLAYPPSETKALNNELARLPKVNRSPSAYGAMTGPQIEDKIQADTLKYSEKIAKSMGKEGSPLAIAEELKAKGYDPSVWLKYVGDHKRDLDLTERQGRELQYTLPIIPPINDLYLFYSSGLDKLVED